MTEHNPIQQIQKLGIPTNSYIVAAQAAGDFRDKSDIVRYNAMISAITNSPSDYTGLPMAQMVFGYLVQEHVRNFTTTNDIDSEYIESLAVQRAQKFTAEQPWHWAEDAAETAAGGISKREEAMRIMKMFPENTDRASLVQALVNQLEVTSATALTYIRAAVKDEEVEVTFIKEPKINKKAAAFEIVKANSTLDKKALISMITEQLATSPAGAQTYYYAAIKELDIKPTGATKRVNTKALVAVLFDENPNISRIEFLEAAEIRFGVQVTTAQTYFYAITAERKALKV